MNKINEILNLLNLLDEHYPHDGKCFLNYNEDWQLLIATILSAQCTDARVNLVTEQLFKKYHSIESFASVNISELESDIKSTGFYHNKAKNIILCAQRLLEVYGGKMPSDIEELTSLAGVGRKTANVIRGHIFSIPSIVVDTHVKRVSYRLGLTNTIDPEKAEFQLMEILPKESWIKYNQQVISHGREICTAKRAGCEECFLKEICEKKIENST
ncbi:MAG: endonuclease III [Defluviitaleaceae bacterium]|nr:endonuclease III [Defluviitaleaceae bacterium]